MVKLIKNLCEEMTDVTISLNEVVNSDDIFKQIFLVYYEQKIERMKERLGID